jgi:CubicO group peptidase (beta-lactamase class C family)
MTLRISLLLAFALARTALAQDIAGLSLADSMVRAEYARDSTAGVTVGVIVEGKLRWTNSLGFADIAQRRPASRETVYRIGSVTKMFTGVMLHQLVAAGVVRLSEPVEKFYPEIRQIPGLPAGSKPVTFLQLATMTSGLAAEPLEEGPFWTGRVVRWETVLRSALPHARYTYAPGERFSYSNIGYAILGAALARAARTPYVTWQQKRILAPLGMSSTSFEPASSQLTRLARGYEIDTTGAADTTLPARELREGRGYKVPNGALFTTVDDLAKFVAFQMGHGPDSVLAGARLDTAYAGIVAASADLDVGYGLGFLVQRRADFT